MDYTPMLALTARAPIASLGAGWIFDEKLDGIRCVATWDGTCWELRSRTGRSMTSSFPDVIAALPTEQYPCVLDGEIVADSGAFQDIARRDKITKPAMVRRAAEAQPASLVAFDCLVTGGKDIRRSPWSTRRDIVECFADLGVKVTRYSADPGFFAEIKAAGGEGVVAKRTTAPYVAGRSQAWVKYKATQSVTCIVIGYKPGHGSRSHMGAITLAMLDGARVVEVGEAGSGFSPTTSVEMKTAVDAVASSGNMLALPIVEIEVLGVTRQGRLRQPVFKGVRGDLHLTDVTTAQLRTLNVS